jgi:hypothetical protein|tara:strand:- start:1403 stop:1687 length:285 start_codon:yes stop_codon:yes gene_type:complete
LTGGNTLDYIPPVTNIQQGIKTVEKEHTITVYRTIQQSVEVTVDSDRKLDDKEVKWLLVKAEDEAAEVSDYDWKTEEVDQMFALDNITRDEDHG